MTGIPAYDDHTNDGRFPDESEVLVPFPLEPAPERQPRQSEEEYLAALHAQRESWPWLPGTIEQQCGPDEWLVTIDDRRLAELEDGSPAPYGTPAGDLWFPQCFRDASEIRATRRLADSPGLRQLLEAEGISDAQEAGQ